MTFSFSEAERVRRNEVISALISNTEENRRITLPDLDPIYSKPAEGIACSTIGLEPNPFGGTCGLLRYQFEDEDLLHLVVTAQDLGEVGILEAQEVASWLFSGVPKALMWFKPGTVTQHFYLGHDDLVRYVDREL